MSELTEKAAETMQGTMKSLKTACALMDITTKGTKKYLPGKSTEDVLHLNLYTFLLYIASADGTISTEEADYINRTLDASYTVEDYRQLALKANVNDPEFAKEVPLFLRAAVDFDNTAFDEKAAE